MINSTVEDTNIWASKFNHSYQSTVEYLADLADTTYETLQEPFYFKQVKLFLIKIFWQDSKKFLC